MPAFAAIDVGSNALRLAVGRVNGERKLEVIETARESVRLGQDVFDGGSISEDSLGQLVVSIQKFRETCQRYHATVIRAVGTSALREAGNRDMVIDEVLRRTGIELNVIGPEEEARLVHLAVSQAVDLQGKKVLIADIGGGSMEVTRVEDGRILETECFLVGAVRLMQRLGEGRLGQQSFQKLVRDYTATFGQRLDRLASGARIDLVVGIGGNVEALGDLRQKLLEQRHADTLTPEELDRIIKRLVALDCADRVKQLGLHPNRADVIVPAAIVFRTVLGRVGASKVVIPRVGLREGMLHDIIWELYQDAPARHRELAVNSARQLGRKYSFDEKHAETVSRFALDIFNSTADLHGLGHQHRLLLEIAALLHDIGQFVNVNGHHKHSYYLIMASPMVGLPSSDRELVANIARYHRKALPSLQHANYQRLSTRDRVIVSKLSAVLRMADALDAEHTAVVHSISINQDRKKIRLSLNGEGDLLLAKWALTRKSELFEKVFGVKLALDS
jgi:exopolyphosphatase/guanosine-5'-triphosphate,3'-diphosphate pyrophosphatase